MLLRFLWHTTRLHAAATILALVVVGFLANLGIRAAPADAQNTTYPASPILSAPLTPEAAYQASVLVKTLGISESQADRDLQVEDAVGNLAGQIEETLGSTYADVWFDPWRGRFDIGTAPSTESGLSKVQSVVAEHGVASVTDFVPVRSTYQELLASQRGWTMRAGDLMQKHQAETMIDASTNTVVVKVSNSATAPELHALSQAASTDTVNVRILQVPPTQLAVQPALGEWLCVFRAENSDYCTPPFIAGTEIYSPPVNGYYHLCTAGFVAQSILPQQYPDHYLLTAGHCFRGNNGYMNGQWGSANNKEQGRGIGYRNYSYINGNGDAAFINLNVETNYWIDGPTSPWYPSIYTPGQHWGPQGEEQYPINIVGTNEAPNVQYQNPCHVGMSSRVQCGVTEYTNVATYVAYHEPTENILVGNLVQNSACSSEGDSGGPWIFYNYAMGLEVGGSGGNCGHGGSGSLFDDLHATDHVLGMRVVGLQGTVE